MGKKLYVGNSAFGFPLGGSQRPEYGQHRIQMGESGTEAVDKIAQREVAFKEIFVIILDVIGQLAHERRVDLLEPAQGITTGIKHVLVADLPPFQLGTLPGPLFAANLDRFSREIELLPLHFQKLPQRIERLVLKIDQEMEQDDRFVGIRRGGGDTRSGRRDFHAIGPGR